MAKYCISVRQNLKRFAGLQWNWTADPLIICDIDIPLHSAG